VGLRTGVYTAQGMSYGVSLRLKSVGIGEAGVCCDEVDDFCHETSVLGGPDGRRNGDAG
jgi:hypothetical protein